MAVQYDGVNDFGSFLLDASRYRKLSIGCRFYWNAYANDSDTLCELGTLVGLQLAIIPNSSSGAFLLVTANGALQNGGTFARPSAAVWHDGLFTFDRHGGVGLQVAAYIDAVPQAITQTSTDAVTNNFPGTTFYLMSRETTSRWAAGRLAEFAIWGGLLGQNDAAQLAAGEPPDSVRPNSLLFYEKGTCAAASVRARSNLVPPPLITYSGVVGATSPVMRASRFEKPPPIHSPIVLPAVETGAIIGAGLDWWR